jgi:hypothetical protein
VAGRIVAEVLVGLLQSDPGSYLLTQPSWQPTLQNLLSAGETLVVSTACVVRPVGSGSFARTTAVFAIVLLPRATCQWPGSARFRNVLARPFVDRRGLHLGNLWPVRESVEDEGAQFMHVSDRDVQQAVVGTEVVVHWHQRAVSPSGERFDGEALGLYEVRDGKFARAQMFYFDAIAVQRFMAAAAAERGYVQGD